MSICKDEDPKEKDFFNRPRKGGKSIWDWLDLIAKLAIPIVVVVVTIAFGLWQGHLADLQHQQDQASALDQQRAAILQTYIDNIQDLLLNHNLLKSKLTGDVAILARARTLTALQGLDPERKGRLAQFIYEADLIGSSTPFGQNIHPPIIILFDANLIGANLADAPLSGADLIDTNLSRADLSRADLSGADLNGADLNGAILNGTDLSGADLGGTKITQRQLDQVNSCQYAILPIELTCHHP